MVKCPRCNLEAKFIKRDFLEGQFDDGTEVVAKTTEEYECPKCDMTIKVETRYEYYFDEEEE